MVMRMTHTVSRTNHLRGVTLLDTIVGTALMLVIFLSIAAAFRLSVEVVTTNKARGGAIALSNERMEYIRSLAYTSVGTVLGVPSGVIAQSEAVSLNGISYTRRTVIQYTDDPKDGLGAADTNGITTDYKTAKVDVAWDTHTESRHITLVSRINPPNGMEIACTPPCGTLSVAVVDAASLPLSGASVSIVNASVSPAVDVSTFTNTDGVASLVGAPAGAGYAIVVSKTGYSSAQTYVASAENPNPNPGNLTVSNGNTTTGTFAIDVLGQKTVTTWTQIAPGTWTDEFTGTSQIASSTGIDVAGGVAQLAEGATEGEILSTAIGPIDLASWTRLSWNDATTSGASIVYRVYDDAGAALVPDSQLPGNSSGFTSSPVDLSGVSTTTYTALRLDAILAASGDSPTLDSWSLDYTSGPTLLPDLAFTLQGAKTIGSGPSGVVYKYSQSFDSGVSASVVIPNLEWDTYTVSVNGTTTGYDIASSCAPQPEPLTPGASLSTDVYFATHSVNSLLVDVRASATGELVPDASVRLYKTGYDTTLTTDSCGQAFFSGLTSSSPYSITVSASGYTDYTSSTVSASGTSRLSVLLN